MTNRNFDPDMFTTPYQLTRGLHRDIYPALDPTNTSLSAHGKVVLIAGAGGGLGAAVARAWAQAGAAGIILVGRSNRSLDLTLANITSISTSVSTMTVPVDISDESSVKTLFSTVKAKFGQVHVLVNSAGSFGGGAIGEASTASWWADFETNVKGTFLLAQAFIQNFDGEGTIINLVSTAVAMEAPGISSYSSSKLAVMKLSEIMSLEYPKLRVFSVHPGIVDAADRGMIVDAFTPFAKDTQALTGGVSLWLDTAEADFLEGGFLSVNWDIDELKAHAAEIRDGKLNRLAFLKGSLGPQGHRWLSM